MTSLTPKEREQLKKELTRGSKSFSLAALFFNSNQREATRALYGWCRYCDDQIDQSARPMEQTQILSELQNWTKSSTSQGPLVFRAFDQLCLDFSIPKQYAYDLLEGMRLDIENTRYQTIHELKLYCYYVAGTVGLMMTHIMGASHQKALQHAVDLGIAMQLTNIARDVETDTHLDRIYLPLQWLKEEDLPTNPQSLWFLIHDRSIKNELRIRRVLHKLLDEADQYYQSGYRGLRYLPLRSGFAVLCALLIYSEIGKIRKHKNFPLEKRAIVSLPKKLFLIGKAVILLFPEALRRLSKPFQPISISAWKQPHNGY